MGKIKMKKLFIFLIVSLGVILFYSPILTWIVVEQNYNGEISFALFSICVFLLVLGLLIIIFGINLTNKSEKKMS